jgi:hypothetical protein
MTTATPSRAGSTSAPSDRGALKLTDVARHVVVPEGIVDTLWFQVARLCATWGDAFDTWQDGLGQVALGLRDTGKFAATVGGVVLSIPRQVAKTFIVGRIVFALCVLYPGLNAIWTAHRISTANSAFTQLSKLARSKGARKYVATIITGNGSREIRFKNGSVLRFGSRRQNFGRGETEVDIEVFDEAQILDHEALEAMVPAANQARLPHGALLFFMGTPPAPRDPGEEFTARRAEALAAKPPTQTLAVHGDSLYVECSADPATGKPGGPDLMDLDQIMQANPSYPLRTPWESILRMRKNIKRDDAWRREALGIWDELEQLRCAIDPFQWRDRKVSTAPTEGVRSYGIKFSPDGVSVSLSAAIKHDHGVHVETIERAPLSEGVWWIVEWFTKERDGRKRYEDAAQIVIDGKAGAVGLGNDLRTGGVPARVLICAGDVDKVEHLTTDNVIAANTMLREAVTRATLTHLEDPDVLDASVVGTTERKIGVAGGWGFAPKTDEDDSTPVESAALAHWAAMTSKRRPGRKTKGRVMA